MQDFVLNAESRPAGNKGAARKVRGAGGVPGVVYRAGEAATPIRVNATDLANIFRKSANPNVIVRVSMGGADRTCLVREVQRHPVSRAVEHIDFFEVSDKDVVSCDVPINPVGRAAGTRAGGTLRVLARSVTVSCGALSLPATIDVDVTPIEVGQFVKVSQVTPPAGVTLVYAQDFNVLTVEGKKTARDDVPEAAAAVAAPAAEPAKAAAPAGKGADKGKKG